MLINTICNWFTVLTGISSLYCDFDFVSREQWGARNSKSIELLNSTPKYVFIHHTNTPGACYDLDQCINAMRDIQNFHMDIRKWDDIGYSFAVGSDGRVYEGRGWDRVGAHTLGYNAVGLGFVVIGNYETNPPNELSINTLIKLIDYAVENEKIDKNYILRGHRDVRPTSCPGKTLYDIIQKWPHY